MSQGAFFLSAFQELKAATGDSPRFLEDNWRQREDLQRICDALAGFHLSFRVAEDWTPIPLTPHVSPAALSARRDYEDRWFATVARVADRRLIGLLEEILSKEDGGDEQQDPEPPVDRLKIDIENWQENAKEDVRNVSAALDWMYDSVANDTCGDLDWLDDSLRSWDRLVRVVGLDIGGAFWRRRALPHVLVPSHVSALYGVERASIYQRLGDAGRAFTFGAPLAALAMQRAVLEELLKNHWGSPEGNIRDANLPELSHDARANRLKRLANEALHGDQVSLAGAELDREIIKNFLLLRELIEIAPETGR